MATAQELEARRAKTATWMKDVAKRLSDSEASQKAMTDEIKGLAEAAKTLKDLDIKKLLETVEQLKAQTNQVVENIKRSSAFNIPGAESLHGKFSMIKAWCATVTNGKVFGKSDEWALMQEAREKVGNVIGVDTEGGWFVPDQVIPEVIASIYKRAVFLDMAGDGTTRVSVLDGLTGASVRIPKFKKGCIAYWGGELDKATLSKVSAGMLELKPRKLNVLTKLSEEQRRFATFGFENMLRNDMIRAAAEEIDRVIPYGSGNADQPAGFTRLDIQKYYAETGTGAPSAGTGGELDWTGLSNMDLLVANADLNKDDTFATISSPSYFNRISNIRVLNYSGQPSAEADYLAGLPPITKQRLRDLIGDYGETTLIPANKNLGATGNKGTDVFRGNFGEILVGRWSGIEFVTENGYDIIDDSRLMKLRFYMDLNSRYPKSVVWCPDARAIQ